MVFQDFWRVLIFWTHIYILHIFKIKNDKKNHVKQKLIAMSKSDSLFLYTNIYMLKIHENNKKIVWESVCMGI